MLASVASPSCLSATAFSPSVGAPAAGRRAGLRRMDHLPPQASIGRRVWGLRVSYRRPLLFPAPRWSTRGFIVCMAPDEEKMTRRSPLDFPIEWERPKPGRRPDIFPQFSPMKTPLPTPLPADPEEEDEEEEEKKEEEEEDPDKEEPEKPEKEV